MFQYFSKNWKNAEKELPFPKEPTVSPAGSGEKIEVMRNRLERGEHLHHPNDELRLKSSDLPYSDEIDEYAHVENTHNQEMGIENFVQLSCGCHQRAASLRVAL